MSEYNPTIHLDELLKEQSRDTYQWSRAMAEAFWQNGGVKVDQEYLHTLLAGAMMSMHDSIYNRELAQRDEAIKVMREALEHIHDTECAGCNLSEVLFTCSNALSKAEQILGGKHE